METEGMKVKKGEKKDVFRNIAKLCEQQSSLIIFQKMTQTRRETMNPKHRKPNQQGLNNQKKSNRAAPKVALLKTKQEPMYIWNECKKSKTKFQKGLI